MTAPARVRSGRASAWGLAAIPVLFWGSSFVATKVALRAFSPWDVVGLRSILGAAVLLGALAARRAPGVDEPRRGDGARPHRGSASAAGCSERGDFRRDEAARDA